MYDNSWTSLPTHARERAERAKRKIPLRKKSKAGIVPAPKAILLLKTHLEKTGDFLYLRVQKGVSFQRGLSLRNFRICRSQKEYEAAGADCISVLTEPKWFLGSNEYLEENCGMRFPFPACARILPLMNI